MRKPAVTGAVAGVLVLTVAGFAGAADEHDEHEAMSASAVSLDGSTVTLSRSSVTADGETPLGESAAAVIGEDVEFADSGPYIIDVSDASVSMTWDSGDAQQESLDDVVNDGASDAYRLTFDEPVLKGLVAIPHDGSSLVPNVSVVSENELLIELLPGTQVGDGFAALIELSPAGAAAGDFVKVSLNDSTKEEMVAAFEAAGIPGADAWANEIIGHRPFPVDDPTFGKLLDDIAPHDPDPAVVEIILGILEP